MLIQWLKGNAHQNEPFTWMRANHSLTTVGGNLPHNYLPDDWVTQHRGTYWPVYYCVIGHLSRAGGNFIWSAHHWEFSVPEPHDPSGSLCSSTASRHPPGDDASGPPGEPAQLPPDQLPNPEATPILKHTHTENTAWHFLHGYTNYCSRFQYRIPLLANFFQYSGQCYC